MGFALAGWMLRHCQYEEKQKAVFEDIAQKRDAARAEMAARSELLESYRDVAIAEVQLQADLDLIANDRTVDIQKAEIYAHTEIEVTQMEASEAIFEAQTAGMTEEQKQEYIKQLREMKTPYLQGSQTLQGTIDPNDKVTGSEPGAMPSAASYAPQDNKTAWVQNLIKQTALIWGNQGGGKSWLARYVAKLKKEAGYRVIVLDPKLAKKLLETLYQNRYIDPNFVDKNLFEPPTERQIQVLRLLAQGLVFEIIAKEMFLSVSTVKNYASDLYSKWHVKNRYEAIKRGAMLGYIDYNSIVNE